MAGVLSSTLNNTGTLSSVANGTGTTVSTGSINVSIWGTFVGTIQLQRSFDGGTTWIPRAFNWTSTLATSTVPISWVFDEGELGVQYRVACTAYTSGTINYRISQQ